jgi:hypothetical protein
VVVVVLLMSRHTDQANHPPANPPITAHTIQHRSTTPTIPRDLARNWDIDIASSLEDYLEGACFDWFGWVAWVGRLIHRLIHWCWIVCLGFWLGCLWLVD